MAEDPRWPRAAAWLATATAPDARIDLALLGIPAHATSLSPTRAHATPAAIRAALARYGTWVPSLDADLRDLVAVDAGDADDPDSEAGELATIDRVAELAARAPVLALGGDNSITYAVARGAAATGLITLDAHHDLRDGRSNGSPVRRLLDAGVNGRRVVQIGIADFTNSRDYAAVAADHGITVIHRDVLDRRPMTDVMAEALDIAGADSDARVHLDLDVDVCDRAVAPACPASAPGGISAAELRTAARVAAADSRVVSFDIAEIDATADTADLRTVRLGALLVLEIAAGLLDRGSSR